MFELFGFCAPPPDNEIGGENLLGSRFTYLWPRFGDELEDA